MPDSLHDHAPPDNEEHLPEHELSEQSSPKQSGDHYMQPGHPGIDAPLSTGNILSMQRTAGNQAVQRTLAPDSASHLRRRFAQSLQQKQAGQKPSGPQSGLEQQAGDVQKDAGLDADADIDTNTDIEDASGNTIQRQTSPQATSDNSDKDNPDNQDTRKVDANSNKTDVARKPDVKRKPNNVIPFKEAARKVRRKPANVQRDWKRNAKGAGLGVLKGFGMAVAGPIVDLVDVIRGYGKKNRGIMGGFDDSWFTDYGSDLFNFIHVQARYWNKIAAIAGWVALISSLLSFFPALTAPMGAVFTVAGIIGAVAASISFIGRSILIGRDIYQLKNATTEIEKTRLKARLWRDGAEALTSLVAAIAGGFVGAAGGGAFLDKVGAQVAGNATRTAGTIGSQIGINQIFNSFNDAVNGAVDEEADETDETADQMANPPQPSSSGGGGGGDDSGGGGGSDTSSGGGGGGGSDTSSSDSGGGMSGGPSTSSDSLELDDDSVSDSGGGGGDSTGATDEEAFEKVVQVVKQVKEMTGQHKEENKQTKQVLEENKGKMDKLAGEVSKMAGETQKVEPQAQELQTEIEKAESADTDKSQGGDKQSAKQQKTAVKQAEDAVGKEPEENPPQQPQQVDKQQQGQQQAPQQSQQQGQEVQQGQQQQQGQQVQRWSIGGFFKKLWNKIVGYFSRARKVLAKMKMKVVQMVMKITGGDQKMKEAQTKAQQGMAQQSKGTQMVSHSDAEIDNATAKAAMAEQALQKVKK